MHADFRGNLVGRVPSRGEQDVFQQTASLPEAWSGTALQPGSPPPWQSYAQRTSASPPQAEWRLASSAPPSETERKSSQLTENPIYLRDAPPRAWRCGQ